MDQIHIKPGAKVLYLGAASGTTVSHVSDIVGPVSGRGGVGVGVSMGGWRGGREGKALAASLRCVAWSQALPSE